MPDEKVNKGGRPKLSRPKERLELRLDAGLVRVARRLAAADGLSLQAWLSRAATCAVRRERRVEKRRKQEPEPIEKCSQCGYKDGTHRIGCVIERIDLSN